MNRSKYLKGQSKPEFEWKVGDRVKYSRLYLLFMKRMCSAETLSETAAEKATIYRINQQGELFVEFDWRPGDENLKVVDIPEEEKEGFDPEYFEKI